MSAMTLASRGCRERKDPPGAGAVRAQRAVPYYTTRMIAMTVPDDLDAAAPELVVRDFEG